MTLGEQIRKAREEKNYSQEELASRLEVSRQAISKWENDIAIPKGINREMLNQELELSLFNIEEDPTVEKANFIGMAGWIVAGILAVCFIIALIYIKTRLPLVNDNSDDSRISKMKTEEKVSQEVVNCDVDNIEKASAYLATADDGTVLCVSILIKCQNELSEETKQSIYEEVEKLLHIEKKDIYIAAEILPKGKIIIQHN